MESTLRTKIIQNRGGTHPGLSARLLPGGATVVGAVGGIAGNGRLGQRGFGAGIVPSEMEENGEEIGAKSSLDCNFDARFWLKIKCENACEEKSRAAYFWEWWLPESLLVTVL